MEKKSAFENLTNKELLQGLKDPEKAQAIITEIQDSLEVIVTEFESMKTVVAQAHSDLDKACKLARDNEQACIDLTQSIKNIHIALNSERETLSETLVKLTDELGKFVMSGRLLRKSSLNI